MELKLLQIYRKVLEAQLRHTKFLNATEKNLSYYLFGKDIPLVKNLTFPQIDLVQALETYTPEAYNPLAFCVQAFSEELSTSNFLTNVVPYPVKGKEPYESFADQIEDHLTEVHRKANRKLYLKSLVFELLQHGYFGIYSDGKSYWFLTAYECIPGDDLIRDAQKQPFWVRRLVVSKASLLKWINTHKSKISLEQEDLNSLDLIPPLDNIVLLDTWIKDMDLNVCFTSAGQVLYQQPFPFPKRYPIHIASDNDLMDSFYPRPLLNVLRPLLKKYQNSISNIEESSKSIGKPILSYDADAGIDVNALYRALKEGYKQVIIGKNREGKIEFHQPGQLPAYSLKMPELVQEEMMRHLGISGVFLGAQTRGLRERGALSKLLKTSFRKLGIYASVFERVFEEVDNYLIEYLGSHQMSFNQDVRFKNIEQVFSGGTKYIATERFKGFETDDTSEQKNLAMVKFSRKLIPREQALRELGHHQPKRIIDKIQQEAESDNELLIKLKAAQSRPPVSVLDKIYNRLKGHLTYRFFIMPISDDKALVKCSHKDEKLVAFLLSDLSNNVLIELIQKSPAPPEQKTPEIKPVAVPPTPEEKAPEGEVPEGEAEETRGRPTKRPAPTGEELKEALSAAVAKETKPREERSSSPPFSEQRLKELVARRSTFNRPHKFTSLPGMYIVEPHAKWIFSGKKTLIVKSRKFKGIVDKPMLLCGRDKIYGVIIVRNIIEDFSFEKTRRHHQVSPGNARSWWFKRGPQKLYAYLFEFHPFPEPVSYDGPPKGVQTFIAAGKVPVRSDIGLPYTGDLKPMTLSPWKIPPPHKPEKRAFHPQEVFKMERLMELVPEATYDISEKIDGLRCFAWIHDGEVKMYSDVGNLFNAERLAPLLTGLKKTFKHTVLLDGELVMEGIRRKDVAGYIHSKGKPSPELLKTLRYIVWDILFIKDQTVAQKPFSTRSSLLNLYLKTGCKGPICRVRHLTAKRDSIPAAVKKLTSVEGAVIRDAGAAYWATHSTYKMKYQYDVDAKVFAVAKTKTGLPIFFCQLKDGTYIGSTYAQSEVKAKAGDVIRVNVDHVSIRPDGSVNWYAPKPKSFKSGKITPKKVSTTQVGIGGADNIDLIKEIYLATGGSKDKWSAWWPKHQAWKKDKLDKVLTRIKTKSKEGVSPVKII